MLKWIAAFKLWLFGIPYPMIGGPMDGRTMDRQLPRYLYPDVVRGKERVHIYRFTVLRLQDDTALAAYVSETLTSEQAIARYEARASI